MAHILEDFVQESTTSTGTGNLTLAGAVSPGRTFGSVCANNDTFFYAVKHRTSNEWETGLGTYVSATPAVARTTVLASSNAGAAVNFSAGTKDVYITRLAQRLPLPHLASTPPVPATGLLSYSKDRFGIPMPYAIGPLGTEMTYLQDSLLVVRNQTGSTIPAFTPVYSSGTGSGGEPLVAPAEADVVASMPCIGVTVDSIGNNANGRVMRAGVLTNINTSGFSVNDMVYVSETAGALTTTPPTFPSYVQKVGRILASHATDGVAMVYNFPAWGDAIGGVRFAALAANPAAAAAGEVYLYAKARAGRIVPRWIGPSGIDTAVQPALWGNAITMWLPGTGTTAGINFGVNWTVQATQAHPTIADTNVMTRIKRATFTCTTTSTAQSGVRSGAPVAIRNAGFFFCARFGFLAYVSTSRVMVGLSALSGALNAQPSAVNDTVAMTKDSGETTWQVMTRDTTAASKTSTGRTTAAGGNAEVFDFTAFCKPADTSITVRVDDIAAGNTPLADTVKSSNLPTSSTPLYAHCDVQATVASSNPSLFCSKMYIESDN